MIKLVNKDDLSMKQNLFLTCMFIVFLSQSAIATQYVDGEETLMQNEKVENLKRSMTINLDEDVETADVLFYSSQEDAGERAFNIYVQYYERAPEVCGFFGELDPQILPNLIKGATAEAKKRFLEARKQRISKPEV